MLNLALLCQIIHVLAIFNASLRPQSSVLGFLFPVVLVSNLKNLLIN